MGAPACYQAGCLERFKWFFITRGSGFQCAYSSLFISVFQSSFSATLEKSAAFEEVGLPCERMCLAHSQSFMHCCVSSDEDWGLELWLCEGQVLDDLLLLKRCVC